MALPENAADFKEELKGDVLIVRIKGRLDALSSPLTEKKICDFIENGQSKVLLDMGGVTYLSSAGMRMLLSTMRKLRTFSGRLVVCSTTPNVLDVLKISGFDHVLELFKSEDEALKQL
jgi:anti-sigma B factor antagonist/stage II sporulation protein AA (anti-sigma F factor antagonist)